MTLHPPLRWVPTLYFAMGLPFVVLNMVSAVLFKDLGISDAQIAFWTSLDHVAVDDQIPVEPLPGNFPYQKILRRHDAAPKRHIVRPCCPVASPTARSSRSRVAVFAVVAFSGATHDIAADGVYMSELIACRPRRSTSAGRVRSTTLRNWSPRAVWCGLRGGFTRVSRPTARLLTTPLWVRGRSFCCSCASRSSLWAFTISARFLQAARLQKAARCGMAFRA